MTIDIIKNSDKTIIKVEGRLDTNTAPALNNAINDDIANTENLVIDLKGLEYISSAGLRVMLVAHKKMSSSGSMKLINVCEAVMEVFEMTGFADVLVIE